MKTFNVKYNAKYISQEPKYNECNFFTNKTNKCKHLIVVLKFLYGAKLHYHRLP